MKLNMFYFLAIALFGLQACNTKTSTFWVNGQKEDCTGVGKQECLQVNYSDDYTNGDWENFYAPIKGFDFEEGIMKQIVVSEKPLKNVPADASSIEYTFVKELNRKAMEVKSTAEGLNGKWMLAKLYGNPINRMVVVPTLTINTAENTVGGNGGCNSYGGDIEGLTDNTIELSEIISTLMLCDNENIEASYFTALNNISTYKVDGNELYFYNKKGAEVLHFIPYN